MLRRLCSTRYAMAVLVLFGLGLVGGTGVARGDDDAVAKDSVPAPVPLDRLLRLPSGLRYQVETRGGMTRSEWRARFTKATREHDEAETSLKASQTELSEIASKSAAWNLGTPGTGGANADPDTPLSFQLNQKIRRHRREVEETDAKLETLKVEANIAHVPKEWREPAPETARETVGDDDW